MASVLTRLAALDLLPDLGGEVVAAREQTDLRSRILSWRVAWRQSVDRGRTR
jgi:hypothetical protein